VALGWNLNGYRLLDPDEGRNAEVAREMAQTNDYVVPHLDGLPYLDKPIVYFAAAAAIMEFTGPTETAARLPAYLATLATIALLAAFARRRWGDEAGWIAGLAYATMVLPLAYARTAIFDSTLTLCTTAALLWFWDERPVAAWAALAVGALTKGPIAVAIPLIALVPHALLSGTPVRRLFPWRGIAAFAAIVLPWFGAVTLKHPDFAHYVFARETLERMTTRSFHRTAPFWYYLPILPLAAFPWIVPALARLKHWRAVWNARSEPPARDALLLACWVIVPLLFLSLNQSKLPQYVLPIIPAFALAATRNFASSGSATGARAYVLVTAVLGVSLIALTRWLPAPISLTSAEKAAIPPTAVALGIVALCSAALVGLGALARRPRTIMLGYAVVVMTIPLVSGRLLTAVGDDRSAGAIANATAVALRASGGREGGEGATGGTVLGVSAYPPSLPFYLRRTIPVATISGAELTSNYIADNLERFRALPGSSLLPEGSWREALARCAAPTVFVTSAGNRESRAALGAALPLLIADDHYAAYGPCRPRSSSQLPQPPQPPRGASRVR
jgi:4-amino-4-deoxy-L-arabinose transferase-like glycosyltransferase